MNSVTQPRNVFFYFANPLRLLSMNRLADLANIFVEAEVTEWILVKD